MHDLTRLLAVLRNVGLVAGQGAQHIRWHAPNAFRRRLHDAADAALALGEDIEKGLAVEAEGHRPPQLGFVERCDVAVDHQVAADIRRIELADRLRRLVLDVAGQRHRQAAERDVELARDERQDRRRDVADDGVLQPVEIGPAGLPVVGLRTRDADGPGSTFKKYYPEYYDLALSYGLDPALKPTKLDISETVRRLGYEPSYSLASLLSELAAYGDSGPPQPA